jgi:serine/threonine protein kinase
MNVKAGSMETTTMQSSMLSRRRRPSKTASNHPDRLKKRDIAFTHQTVSVVKKLGEFGTSYLYSAKDDSSPRREGKSLLIKATAAATTEQARRAEAEVGLLRKLRGAPGILTIIDCGFSTIEERIYDDSADDDRLEARRLYCVLLEPCPDCFLNDFIKKRRRKFTNKGSRSLFTRKKKDTPWEGYLPIETILDIFGQMVSAISAIHNFKDEPGTRETPSAKKADGRQRPPEGIVHLDVQPSRFLVRRMKEKDGAEHRYDVKLCSFGCSIRGGMSITSEMECDEASKLIESSSSPMYRSPEMIDLSLADELNTRYDFVSSDALRSLCLTLTALFVKC